jgi:alcohol dehydrogenase (cytochrome c)
MNKIYFLYDKNVSFVHPKTRDHTRGKKRDVIIRRGRMKCIALAAGFAVLAPLGASAQTTDQLVTGATDTSHVLNYGMGHNLQRFSPLTQVNKDTFENLLPAWNCSFARDRAEESQSIAYRGVIYVTTHAATMAVEVNTGKQPWKTKVEYPAETPRFACRGVVNSGVAPG